MNPSHYYYVLFREHFAAFWISLEMHGSVSRARKRLTPSRFADQAAEHFSIIDLVVRPLQGFTDHLTNVPAADQIDFLCSLFYTVLIDKVMYTHCHSDYVAFRALTKYPKMDRTVGYARTLMMANPYELFEDEIVRSRSISTEELFERFTAWTEFIAQDLRSFFADHQIGASTWPVVREAMLHDPSCTCGSLGMALSKALQADSANAI